jgi:hypothetical protein
LEVSVCTSPAFGIKGIFHYWIKTATKSAGMAGDENRAGGLGSIIVDHSFRDTEKDSSCTEKKDIDESCVNTYIDVTLDQEFGYWFPPVNYCKTYVNFVMDMCTNKK